MHESAELDRMHGTSEKRWTHNYVVVTTVNAWLLKSLCDVVYVLLSNLPHAPCFYVLAS